MTGSTISNHLGLAALWSQRRNRVTDRQNLLINKWMTMMFVEEPLSSPRSDDKQVWNISSSPHPWTKGSPSSNVGHIPIFPRGEMATICQEAQRPQFSPHLLSQPSWIRGWVVGSAHHPAVTDKEAASCSGNNRCLTHQFCVPGGNIYSLLAYFQKKNSTPFVELHNACNQKF